MADTINRVADQNTTGWVGWIYFAGILMLVRSVFQGFFGIVALSKNTFYLVTQQQLAVFDFSAWGWIHIILAIILLTGGFSLFSGGLWGRIVATFGTALSLVANLIFLPAYPVWSIAAIIIDILVLYALLVHGDETRIRA
ncbi:MAG TPA: hypothetical protein VF401_00465 [Candidatus Saccharimonadales bacterium]